MNIDWEQYVVETDPVWDTDTGRWWKTHEPTGKGRMTINGIRVPFKLGTRYLRWRSRGSAPIG